MAHAPAHRIASFGLNSADAAALADFYVAAFGARQVARQHLGEGLPQHSWGVSGGASRYTLQLGEQLIEIWQFHRPGAPVPHPLSPFDPTFQHLALVVSDMTAALAQLQQTTGWTPITLGGPQHLPQRSGGVTAFKFQDPEGHPLELLEFRPEAVPSHWQAQAKYGIFRGIDHSAISVRDTAISVQFYESLGFAVTGQTLNHGPSQANLDGVPNPQVEVTALSLASPVPHLELLCYRSVHSPPPRNLAVNDAAATRVLLAADGKEHLGSAQQLIIDPDGHRLLRP